MVQYQNNSRKNLARSLRQGGYSYAEIQKFVSVPKATLNYWLSDIKLSEAQAERLRKKRSDSVKVAGANRIINRTREIESIEHSSVTDIGKLSKRELWLMGVMLYWKNQNRSDVKTGVRFMSSDPYLIKLFLKWLKEIGQLKEDELAFDIFGKKTEKVIHFWSETTGLSRGHFTRFYRHNNKSEYGLLQIRVKASSMLARQMAGWIKGIQQKV